MCLCVCVCLGVCVEHMSHKLPLGGGEVSGEGRGMRVKLAFVRQAWCNTPGIQRIKNTDT